MSGIICPEYRNSCLKYCEMCGLDVQTELILSISYNVSLFCNLSGLHPSRAFFLTTVLSLLLWLLFEFTAGYFKALCDNC